MRAQIERDKKRRRLYAKYEKDRLAWLIKMRSDAQNQDLSILASIEMSKLPRNSAKNRIRNRCILTGRGRGVINYFRLSRIQFRKLALEGLLPGIRKASW